MMSQVFSMRTATLQNWRIVHSEASLGWGGQERRVMAELLGFRARGHRVGVVAPCESLCQGDEARSSARGARGESLGLSICGRQHGAMTTGVSGGRGQLAQFAGWLDRWFGSAAGAHNAGDPLRYAKGHRVLFDAMQQLIASGLRVRCVVVGDSPHRTNLEQRVVGLGLSEHVLFLEQRDDVPEILRALSRARDPFAPRGHPASRLAGTRDRDTRRRERCRRNSHHPAR